MRLPSPHRAVLIVVDLQNDFCAGGALAVPGGDEIVGPAQRLIDAFDHVVMTQDWHPPNHMSFAASHPGRQPFDSIAVSYGEQTLWPVHCVQGTRGAEFHPGLAWNKAELVVRKGFHRAIDSYSAFYENDRVTPTGLAGYLRDRGFRQVVLAGLATDFCVAYSAIDAALHGFEVAVVLEACRAIDLAGSFEAQCRVMREAGVDLIAA